MKEHAPVVGRAVEGAPPPHALSAGESNVVFSIAKQTTIENFSVIK